MCVMGSSLCPKDTLVKLSFWRNKLESECGLEDQRGEDEWGHLSGDPFHSRSPEHPEMRL